MIGPYQERPFRARVDLGVFYSPNRLGNGEVKLVVMILYNREMKPIIVRKYRLVNYVIYNKNDNVSYLFERQAVTPGVCLNPWR